MLMEIILALVGDDPTQVYWLMEDLNELVPVFPDEEGGLLYGLYQEMRANVLLARLLCI